MSKVTVYLPDELEDEARAAGIKWSPLLQRAVRATLENDSMSLSDARRYAEVALRLHENLMRLHVADDDAEVVRVGLAAIHMEIRALRQELSDALRTRR